MYIKEIYLLVCWGWYIQLGICMQLSGRFYQDKTKCFAANHYMSRAVLNGTYRHKVVCNHIKISVVNLIVLIKYWWIFQWKIVILLHKYLEIPNNLFMSGLLDEAWGAIILDRAVCKQCNSYWKTWNIYSRFIRYCKYLENNLEYF